ncbi:MAG: GHKL domain-containing protein [Hungatella sp.]|jgi:hypothetical protein|nr:GHKL domain-containing protein [Hungatella sp.]
MDWFGYWFSWYTILPCFLAYVVTPAAAFVFFGRFCGTFVKWGWCALYVLFYMGVIGLEYLFHIKGCGGLVMEVVLLAVFGWIAFGRPRREVLAAAALTQSVLSVTGGILSWIDHRVFSPLVMSMSRQTLIRSGDGVRELLKALGILALFFAVLKIFGKTIEEAKGKVLVWLTVPVFFISMVERIIQVSLYGDSLVFDTVSGEYGALIEIRHGEMLFLQVFAGLCLFLTLFVCERLVKIFQEIQKVQLLEQQAKVQEIYVQEAALRYQQTRGFRHDISNHLGVLSRLIAEGQTEEAGRYLADLGELASGLSWQAQTGNAAVDALLGSKLSAARQKGIQVFCDVKIPKHSNVKDLDWCILLSNGLDNSIKACENLDEESRYLKVETRKKGNFYLILMENKCDRELKRVPEDGTGLSNIRAVMEKYHGRVENEVSEGLYRLKLLFVDP